MPSRLFHEALSTVFKCVHHALALLFQNYAFLRSVVEVFCDGGIIQPERCLQLIMIRTHFVFESNIQRTAIVCQGVLLPPENETMCLSMTVYSSALSNLNHPMSPGCKEVHSSLASKSIDCFSRLLCSQFNCFLVSWSNIRSTDYDNFKESLGDSRRFQVQMVLSRCLRGGRKVGVGRCALMEGRFSVLITGQSSVIIRMLGVC